MKSLYTVSTFLGLFLSTNSFSATHSQICQRVYGSGPFSELYFSYDVVNKTPVGWPVVNIQVEVERSGEEEGIEYRPIGAKEVHYADVLNRDTEYHVESIRDYAGGTISFKSDDSISSPIATLEYVSDGMDVFALYECSDFLEIN